MADAQIAVRVQAAARRNELALAPDGVLRVRVAAPALDGRANRAVCKLIARRVGVPRSQVTIVRGERARDKLVRIAGIDLETVRAALRS